MVPVSLVTSATFFRFDSYRLQILDKIPIRREMCQHPAWRLLGSGFSSAFRIFGKESTCFVSWHLRRSALTNDLQPPPPVCVIDPFIRSKVVPLVFHIVIYVSSRFGTRMSLWQSRRRYWTGSRLNARMLQPVCSSSVLPSRSVRCALGD